LEEIDAPNLVPVLRRAILNNQPIEIFGSSHPTRDGTCERDYIHVLDIVDAHLELIKHFDKLVDGKHETFNLGTGKGYTVLEVIANFEVLWSTKIKKSFTNQRLGEPPSVVCDATYVKNVLGWEATRNPFTGGLDS
jgi:UDP-glucose 4-epimerase